MMIDPSTQDICGEDIHIGLGDKETNPPNVEACLDVETERLLKLFEQLA